MRRLFALLHRSFVRRAVLGLATLLALADSHPARAAMATDVADAAEPEKTIDINVDIGYHHDSHNVTIGREEQSTSGQVYNASELSYTRVRDTMDARVTIGMYHDLEFHIYAPYIISDTQNWNYASINGQSVASMSTVATNTQNAGGYTCTAANPCPTTSGTDNYAIAPGGQNLFTTGNAQGQAVPGTLPGQVSRSGFGDPTIGIAWGIFNEQRDSHLRSDWYPTASRTATWTVGLDYTIPAAGVMDPSSTLTQSSGLPVGEGTHKIELWSSMSKRFGPVEPYFRVHFTGQIAASNAYNNCNIVGKDPDYLIMSLAGQDACANTADPFWPSHEVLQPSQIGGLLLGTEFHPFDRGADKQALNISLQFRGDYISKGLNYSELSDLMHKLTYTDQYFSVDTRLTVDLRIIRLLHWVTYFSIGTDTTHFLTDQNVGIPCNARSSGSVQCSPMPTTGVGSVNLPSNANSAAPNNEVDPSYDFRVDAPGHRFLAMSVLNYTISTGLNFRF